MNRRAYIAFTPMLPLGLGLLFRSHLVDINIHDSYYVISYFDFSMLLTGVILAILRLFKRQESQDKQSQHRI